MSLTLMMLLLRSRLLLLVPLRLHLRSLTPWFVLSRVRQKAAISGAEAIIAIKAVATVMFAKVVTAFVGTKSVIDAAIRPILWKTGRLMVKMANAWWSLLN